MLPLMQLELASNNLKLVANYRLSRSRLTSDPAEVTEANHRHMPITAPMVALWAVSPLEERYPSCKSGADML